MAVLCIGSILQKISTPDNAGMSDCFLLFQQDSVYIGKSSVLDSMQAGWQMERFFIFQRTMEILTIYLFWHVPTPSYILRDITINEK